MRELNNKIRIALLYFSIILFIVGVVLFLVGFHNVDTATNMLRVQIYTKQEFTDIGLSGEFFTTDEGYLSGMLFVIVSLFIFLISFCMLLGVVLWWLEEKWR
jgi:hypothetical protein